ncbi:hypothetical protein NDN08_001199 [Rhodosorus marinus]|uniref:Ion transport domain-containing protein n=1 Tax=Rhodosorus marinus TaxID=101924 RepID=A0AAV8UT55_9RHOD|nr:hypothetical protein NDN08_001199 [Rhodosorus marinus]
MIRLENASGSDSLDNELSRAVRRGSSDENSSLLSGSQRTLQAAFTGDRITSQDGSGLIDQAFIAKRKRNRFTFWLGRNLYHNDDSCLEPDAELARRTATELAEATSRLERTTLLILLLTLFVDPVITAVKHDSLARGFQDLWRFGVLDTIVIYVLIGLLGEPFRTCESLLTSGSPYLEEYTQDAEQSLTLRTVISLVQSFTKFFFYLNKYFIFRLSSTFGRTVVRSSLLALRVESLGDLLPIAMPESFSDIANFILA